MGTVEAITQGDQAPQADAAASRLADLAVLLPASQHGHSLADQAYYVLRDRIVTLELAPSTLVNERALADETGLGRTPVREALLRLATEDLVEVYPRRGIYVGSIDVGDLSQISEVRVELEGFVARLAAQRISDVDRQPFHSLLDALRAVRGDDQRALIHLDQRIHRQLSETARNPFLTASLARYYVLSLRLWFLAIERMHQLADAVTEHVALIEAVLAADAVQAEMIARKHVTDFEQQIRALL